MAANVKHLGNLTTGWRTLNEKRSFCRGQRNRPFRPGSFEPVKGGDLGVESVWLFVNGSFNGVPIRRPRPVIDTDSNRNSHRLEYAVN